MEKRMCWLALCWLLGGCLDGSKHEKASPPRPVQPSYYPPQQNPNSIDRFGAGIKDHINVVKDHIHSSLFSFNKPNKFGSTANTIPIDATTGIKGDGGAGGFPAYTPTPNKEVYVTKFDKINIDEILRNKRLLLYYFNCLMSKGPCPPDGRELKRVLPEALATGCAKCTKKQIEAAVKVIKYFREFEPERFELLANVYDPHGIYRRKYFDNPLDNDVITSNSLTGERNRRMAAAAGLYSDNHPRKRLI
ncbi:hypothetical protein TKK_0008684 [Trichogramma kaykai]|uniref:Uncharacterized protein n=1 Tax=Trichogramma kaykai TaxID=54128 RepID=A0ABD2X5I3_9HYME